MLVTSCFHRFFAEPAAVLENSARVRVERDAVIVAIVKHDARRALARVVGGHQARRRFNRERHARHSSGSPCASSETR